jgi:hypothetical protein
MNKKDLDEIRVRHYETSLWWRQDSNGTIVDELLGCNSCGEEMPCDTIRLLNELERISKEEMEWSYP